MKKASLIAVILLSLIVIMIITCINESSPEPIMEVDDPDLIGVWYDSAWSSSAKITIAYIGKDLTVTTRFTDGSEHTSKVTSVLKFGLSCFETRNELGEYYIITEDGGLELYDCTGYIRTAR